MVIVTINVEGRYRGFLASAMLEIAPGVYTSPNMTSGHSGGGFGRSCPNGTTSLDRGR